jgi:hypothetical protein
MKLVIIPGAGDPFKTYTDVYDLIKTEAIKRGFSDVIIINFYGHYSFDGESVLNIKKTISLLVNKLQIIEEQKESYIILCKSYGCMPFIEILKTINIDFKFLKKVIFWAPSPYYIWYDYLKSSFNIKDYNDRCVRVDHNLFDEIYPFELSINQIPETTNFDIVITSGDLDNDYPESFHNTLKEINNNPRIYFPARIPNLGHSVKNPNEEYFKTILE